MSDRFSRLVATRTPAFEEDLVSLSSLQCQVAALYRDWLARRIARSRQVDRSLWQNALVTECLEVHGLDHWARVGTVGVALLRSRLDAAPEEALGFHRLELENAMLNAAFFHDIARANEHRDHGHGERGARIYEKLAERGGDAYGRPELVPLIAEAIRRHGARPAALPDANLILRCLSSADRLDRPRFGDIVDRSFLYPDLDIDRWQAPAEALVYEETDDDTDEGRPLTDRARHRAAGVARPRPAPRVHLWGTCEGGPIPLGAYPYVRLVADRDEIRSLTGKTPVDFARSVRECDLVLTGPHGPLAFYTGPAWAIPDRQDAAKRIHDLELSASRRLAPPLTAELLYVWGERAGGSQSRCCRGLRFDDGSLTLQDHELQVIAALGRDAHASCEQLDFFRGSLTIAATPSRPPLDGYPALEVRGDSYDATAGHGADQGDLNLGFEPPLRRSSSRHITRRSPMSNQPVTEPLFSPDVVFEKSGRGRESLATALQYRGFFVEERGDVLQLSDNVQWEDRRDFEGVLRKSGLPATCWTIKPGSNTEGTPAERRPNVLVSTKSVDAWLSADPRHVERAVTTILNLRECVEGEAPNRLAAWGWPTFRRHAHGYKIRALDLDAGVAYLVKALNAIGAATWCSCFGHDEHVVRIDIPSAYWGAWAKAVVEHLGVSDSAWSWTDGNDQHDMPVCLRVKLEDRSKKYRSAVRAADAMYQRRVELREVRRAVIETFEKPRREPPWQELYARAEELLKKRMPIA